MIDQFINFVIRPPRAEYSVDQYLWETEFTLAGRKYKRQDLELTNARGHKLQCSHYVPYSLPENIALPCVIYCHGNSGCRADANEAAVILLPSNITVFTLDFSGSGQSDGDYVSLGWHEKNDLRIVVQFLRSNKQVSCIGLWGRSMGAVTSLLYGAEDPSIAGMVLDSAFANLFDLMMELVDVYKIRLPKFTVKMAVQYMRRVIQKKAKFDIMDLNTIQFAPKTFIPALFGHASEDIFIQPHHSDQIYQSYAGDKNIIKFEGDHNSPRPQFYYDSVSIFFYNVLHPPQISSMPANESKLEKYYNLGNLKVGSAMDECLLYEIIARLRASGNNAASSSTFPPIISTGSTADTVVEMLSESLAHMSAEDEEYRLDQENTKNETAGSSGGESHLQDKSNGQNEECCSYSSSNPKSWGRCSSLGGSDGSSPAEFTGNTKSKRQAALRLLVTPLRRFQWRSSAQPKDKKKGSSVLKKLKLDKLEKGETLRQRLRHCISRRVKHKKHQSS